MKLLHFLNGPRHKASPEYVPELVKHVKSQSLTLHCQNGSLLIQPPSQVASAQESLMLPHQRQQRHRSEFLLTIISNSVLGGPQQV